MAGDEAGCGRGGWLDQKGGGEGTAGSDAVMSTLYEGGYGVAQSEKDALVWLEKSVDGGRQGSDEAAGAVYENGTFGVTPDKEKARLLKKKAAEVKKAVFPDYAVM